ncbi:N-acetylglucosamine kinase [Undibacterium sp. TJN25]|uniref:N-acetylglucosamine kinase n=1 Tax=Undibacterium sp. TJN25 TaxID=3413056 RepID=UPI003BF1E5A5
MISAQVNPLPAPPFSGRLGLGIDAGGTQTRWALAGEDGSIIAEGFVGGFTALQIGTSSGHQIVSRLFSEIAQSVLAVGRPHTVRAGITGFSGLAEAAGELRSMLARPFGLSSETIILSNDIELAYQDNFAQGEGYLVYSGTGSIAAFIDSDGVFHRAGGHGGVLDDAGGGFWIAREALRHIWRREDELPGSWRSSAMALKVFEHIGGNDWASSRAFIYNSTRGEVGMLALAVAAAADTDSAALAILKNAGCELARLGMALSGRYGEKTIVLAGRVQELHAAVAQSMHSCLPPNTSFRQSTRRPHLAAARIAANIAAADGRHR